MGTKKKKPEVEAPPMLMSEDVENWRPAWMDKLLEVRFEKGFVGMATALDKLFGKLLPAQADTRSLVKMNPKVAGKYIAARNKLIQEHSQELYERFYAKYVEKYMRRKQ